MRSIECLGMPLVLPFAKRAKGMGAGHNHRPLAVLSMLGAYDSEPSSTSSVSGGVVAACSGNSHQKQSAPVNRSARNILSGVREAFN